MTPRPLALLAAGALLLGLACSSRAAPTWQPGAAPAPHAPAPLSPPDAAGGDILPEAAGAPDAGGRLSDAVVPLAYELEVELDPGARDYRGRVTIELRIDEPVRTLWLHAEDLIIDEARVHLPGARAPLHPARIHGPAPDLLGLRLSQALPPGTATLTIAFRGRFGERVGIFRQTVGQDAYLFTDFEPIDARRGFPCFDEPRFKTPWTISLLIPGQVHGLSNMPAVSMEPLAGNQQRIRFAPTRPLPTYLVAFAVGPFDVVEGPTDPVPVRVVTPRGRGAWARDALAVIPPLLRIVQSYMDTPVPFPKLDFVAVPTFEGAMENPGLITVGAHILLVDPDRADPSSIAQARFLALVCAHEIAHLWFGDLATPTDWRDLWLNEGFATWLADKALMAWRPERMPHVDQVEAKLEAMALDELPDARAVRQPVRTRDELRAVFDPITYKKGGALVAMFEAWLSEAGFRQAIQAYMAAHADRGVTAEDLMAALAQVAGHEVGSAFASFLDQPGVPLIRVELACAAGDAPAHQPRAALRLTQERSGRAAPAGDAPALWQVPVCLRHDDGAGAARRTCVLLREASARVPLDTASCPAWVAPNADAAGYYRYHLPPDQLLALARAPLSAREATELVHNLRALAWQGTLDLADILPALTHLARHRGRHVTQAVIALLEDMAAHLADPGEQRRFQAHVRRLYGARASALGLAARPGESEEDTLLRPVLVGFVGHHGRDPGLRASARQRTDQWLRQDRGIEPGMIRVTVALAATSGDAALFDRMERALYEALGDGARAGDATRIAALLEGLAAFAPAALIDRALHLAVAGAPAEVPPLGLEQRYTLLARVLARPEAMPRALAFLERHGHLLAAQKQGRLLLLTPLLDAPLCSEHDLARARILAEQAGKPTAFHAQALDHATRTAHACAHFRAAQARGTAPLFP